MAEIGNFLSDTSRDIYELSIWLENTLSDDYDELSAEQPQA